MITGTVVDKNGSPVPGAKVEIVGGTESTITELDGTFRIETSAPARELKVRYVGMGSKKQEITPNMTIVLGGRGAGEDKFAVVVRAGVGLAKQSWSHDEIEDYINDNEKSLLAPTVSVGVEIPMLFKGFYLMPALGYRQKGMKLEESENDGEYYYEEKNTVTLHYVQLDALAAYRYHLGNDMDVTVKAGPYLAYGFTGKWKVEDKWGNEFDEAYYGQGTADFNPFNGEIGDNENMEEIEVGDIFKEFEIGYTIGAEFAWKKMLVGVEYNHSLNNFIDSDADDGIKVKNKGWYFTLGYRF